MVLFVQTEDAILHGAIPLVEQLVLGGSVTRYVVRVLIVLDAATAMPAAAMTVSAISASNTTILRIRCLLPFAQAATKQPCLSLLLKLRLFTPVADPAHPPNEVFFTPEHFFLLRSLRSHLRLVEVSRLGSEENHPSPLMDTRDRGAGGRINPRTCWSRSAQGCSPRERPCYFRPSLCISSKRASKISSRCTLRSG